MTVRTLLYAALLCGPAVVAGRGQGPVNRPQPPQPQRLGDPSPAAAGHRHPTDRRRQPFLALAGELSNSSATSVEYMKMVWPQARRGENQYRAGGRFVEPDRTARREVRFQCGGRRDPGRARSQPAPRAAVVRKLEEQSLQLRARLGEERFRPVPARPGRRRQDHRTAQPLQRCQPRRRCARLRRPDAPRQGGGWPAAHRHHDPGGERSGHAAATPATARPRPTRPTPGRCRKS